MNWSKNRRQRAAHLISFSLWLVAEEQNSEFKFRKGATRKSSKSLELSSRLEARIRGKKVRFVNFAVELIAERKEGAKIASKTQGHPDFDSCDKFKIYSPVDGIAKSCQWRKLKHSFRK